jgi:hypothetical protein
MSADTVAVLVSLETTCSVHGSCLTRRRWLPFIAPLTLRMPFTLWVRLPEVIRMLKPEESSSYKIDYTGFSYS